VIGLRSELIGFVQDLDDGAKRDLLIFVGSSRRKIAVEPWKVSV
jgi:hypothetical protein